MYPTGVARAASVFATAPSKVPFYLAGGLLAGSAARSRSVQLTADPKGQLAFDRKRASVQRGKFTLRLINRSQIPHNVTIAKGARVLARTKTIQGATTSATANLPAGDYVFFCSVDAHRQAGMEGTLTVR